MSAPVLPSRSSERLVVRDRVVTRSHGVRELQHAVHLLAVRIEHREGPVLAQLVPLRRLALLRLWVADRGVHLAEQVVIQLAVRVGVVEHLGEDSRHEHGLRPVHTHLLAGVHASSAEDVTRLGRRQQHVQDRGASDLLLHTVAVLHIHDVRLPVAGHLREVDAAQDVRHLAVQIRRLHHLLHRPGGEGASLLVDARENLLHQPVGVLLVLL